MVNYFTDTMPNATVTLGSYTVAHAGKVPDEGKPKTSETKVTWNATDIDYENARSWCVNHDFEVVLLQGEKSLTDFEDSLIGSRSVFNNPGNRLTGEPVSLEAGDVCLVMHRQEPAGILRWKLIDSITITKIQQESGPEPDPDVDPNTVPDLVQNDPT